jgi:hypothetical protein
MLSRIGRANGMDHTENPEQPLNSGGPALATELEDEAEAILAQIRPALAEVLRQLNPPVLRAFDLRRRLNLGQKVSWGLFNAARTRDPQELASLLPRRRGMERFLAAAAANGVSEDAIEQVRRAYARFEESVARLARSRDAFETMMGELGLGAMDPTSAELRHKRAAFRANALLWGKQARTFCAALILHPGEKPGMLDMVHIKGMEGLHRTRRGVTLDMTSRRGLRPSAGDPEGPVRLEPLDPREQGSEAVWLLRDFCSRPLPEFRLHEDRPDYRSYEVISERLGSAGEVTYYTGEVVRAITTVPGSVPDSEVTLAKGVNTPLEAYSGDIIIHKSVWGTTPPEVKVYAWPMDNSTRAYQTNLLPLTERAVYLGDGAYKGRMQPVPRYSEMIQYAMDRMGWNGDEFRVFRCRVEYPVMYSLIRMTLR